MANNEHFELQIRTLSVQLSASVSTLFFLPATANCSFLCIHTTSSKTIEMYFTGKLRKVENEC